MSEDLPSPSSAQGPQAAVLVHRVASSEHHGEQPQRSEAAGGPASPARPGGGARPRLRSLLERLGSTFTPGDDISQRPRLSLSITTSVDASPGLPAGPPPPRQQQAPPLGSPAQPRSPTQQQQQQQQQPQQQEEPLGDGGAGLDTTLAEEGSLNLAAAAERHRLLASSVDIRAVAFAVEKALPFLLLLLLTFVWEHLLGLASFAWLTWVLSWLNAVLRSQVALRQDIKSQQLLVAGGAVLAQLPLMALAARNQHVADLLLLRGARNLPAGDGFWACLFCIVSADLVARFAAVLAKIGVLLATRVDTLAHFRRRGMTLTAVEYCAAFYRSFLPAAVWYKYYKTNSSLLANALAGIYILLKVGNMYERLALAAVALRQAVVGISYGSAATADEVAEAGNSCPICQEAFHAPIKLPCQHIFCAECLNEWAERENGSTCPMCRAVIRQNRLRPCSDASTSLLPIVF